MNTVVWLYEYSHNIGLKLTVYVLFLLAQMSMGAFQEYFTYTNCCDQPVSGVGLLGPYFTLSNGTLVTPTSISPNYPTPSSENGGSWRCPYSSVESCIPGITCGSMGKPAVYSVAGAATKRTTTNGQNLLRKWAMSFIGDDRVPIDSIHPYDITTISVNPLSWFHDMFATGCVPGCYLWH